ncbi:hypothetical protein FQN57_003551 [Myotisia sp. PD_48]|nr:hypothetical protein FQN57_003551 [Myotisia sp. PD_48]
MFAKHFAYFSLIPLAYSNPANPFPAVDLGYAVHVPTYINETSAGLKYANYNNIRFAQPPVGNLRFRQPKVPPPKANGIQDGAAPKFSTDCVNAVPGMFGNIGTPVRSWGREDCLFLNVRVPEGVKEGDKVPVIHWVHGSAYVYGSKDLNTIVGDGAGLYDHMSRNQNFIYVASNYRLGLYGWSSSPTEEDMDANVGLHDVLAALQWTQKYISKFGGDPKQITAFGSSAGAGAINLLTVARNGNEDLPFRQAFIASPCVWPRREPSRRQAVFNEVLKAANCQSLNCLRSASEKTLFDANSYLVVNVSDGRTGAMGPGAGFAPVVDGKYIRDFLPILLSEGKVNKKVKRVAVSNMENEGTTMSPPGGMPGIFPSLVRGTIPKASDQTIQKIQSLYQYPPNLPVKLGWDWMTDISFACNAYYTAKQFKNQAQRHVMTIPPAIHALDQAYWFYQNDQITPVANVTIARQFQEYVRRFVTGKENSNEYKGLEDWPKYGPKATIFNVTLDGFQKQRDYWDINNRCDILKDIIFDPENGA